MGLETHVIVLLQQRWCILILIEEELIDDEAEAELNHFILP
jgi:hypothetical protein